MYRGTKRKETMLICFAWTLCSKAIAWCSLTLCFMRIMEGSVRPRMKPQPQYRDSLEKSIVPRCADSTPTLLVSNPLPFSRQPRKRKGTSLPVDDSHSFHPILQHPALSSKVHGLYAWLAAFVFKLCCMPSQLATYQASKIGAC